MTGSFWAISRLVKITGDILLPVIFVLMNQLDAFYEIRRAPSRKR